MLSSTAMVVTLLGYYVLFGKRHRRKRKVLMEELREAQKQVRDSLWILWVCVLCPCCRLYAWTNDECLELVSASLYAIERTALLNVTYPRGISMGCGQRHESTDSLSFRCRSCNSILILVETFAICLPFSFN